MNKYIAGVIVCILIVLLAIVLLVSGSSSLNWAVIDDPFVPFGNVLTWLAVIALPLSLYLGGKRFRSPQNKLDAVFRKLVILAIVLGVLWYPVTWFLADNFSGSFGRSESFRGSALAGEYFWYYSYAVIALPFGILILYPLLRLFRR